MATGVKVPIKKKQILDLPFIRQTKKNGFFCCQIITSLNALVYHGYNVPRLNSKEWKMLTYLGNCRHGSVIGRNTVDKYLGIESVQIKANEIPTNLPVEIQFFSPLIGFHSSLVVHVNDDTWTLVNYQASRSPIIQDIKEGNLDMLGKRSKDYKYWQLRITSCKPDFRDICMRVFEISEAERDHNKKKTNELIRQFQKQRFCLSGEDVHDMMAFAENLCIDIPRRCASQLTLYPEWKKKNKSRRDF